MSKVFRFGSGNLYGIDRNSVIPTPVKFGTLQEGTLEFTFTTKALQGQNTFPDSVARAEGKITGKAKMGQIKADLLGTLFFGATPVTGQIVPIVGEAGTIPAAGGPYTLTVVHGATMYKNLGVIFALTGTPLTRVAEAPATGQYSVVETTGVYTFAAADTGLGIKFDYLYNSALVGKTITIVNQLSGVAPSFMAILNMIFDLKTVVTILNKCISEKLSDAYKQGAHTIMDFEFAAQADDADNIGTISLPE